LAGRLEHDLGATVRFTEAPGHATALAEAADCDGLAVFGGDGTVAEVVRGMDLYRQTLLVLPGGTGNGLARDLGCAMLSGALRAAARPEIRPLDVVFAAYQTPVGWRERLVVSTAAFGYGAGAVERAAGRLKRLGAVCYPAAATLEAFRAAPFEATVTLHGAPARRLVVTHIMVNNTRHAGNFAAFPGADLTDGRLVLLLARNGPVRQLAHNAAVLSRSYLYRAGWELHVRAVDVDLVLPRSLMLDGELVPGVQAARFATVPRRLRCVVAPGVRGLRA
jgi:diacylglycerol kinase (ATP)